MSELERDGVKERIAIVGGTGEMGTGVAYRLLQAGYPVCIGSRSSTRSAAAAAALSRRLGGTKVMSATNIEASATADVIFVTVPYPEHRMVLEGIYAQAQSKLVVDTTVPLQPPKIGRVQLPQAGSAALEAQQILGEEVDVVSAFQNVGAGIMNDDAPIDCDVLVTGDKVSARERVVALAEAMGMHGWHAGPLANSAAAEALTSVLIHINKRYCYPAAGIRITNGRCGVLGSSYAPDHLELLAPKDLPMVNAGDNLVEIILNGCRENQMTLRAGDVLVIAQKVVSKAEGQTVAWDTIEPSPEAQRMAAVVQKDPRLVELILRESKRVVRQAPGVLIVEHRLGFVMANAGVDQSNTLPDCLVLLPRDPDRSAAQLARDVYTACRVRVAVIVSDSIGRAWRNGTIGQALGVSGLSALEDLRGTKDLFNRVLRTTEVAVADEIAAAASLLMGQAAEGKPVVIVRGFAHRGSNAATGQSLLRDPTLDLFR